MKIIHLTYRFSVILVFLIYNYRVDGLELYQCEYIQFKLSIITFYHFVFINRCQYFIFFFYTFNLNLL